MRLGPRFGLGSEGLVHIPAHRVHCSDSGMVGRSSSRSSKPSVVISSRNQLVDISAGEGQRVSRGAAETTGGDAERLTIGDMTQEITAVAVSQLPL